MCFFFFKQKTAYEMRISDWSSDVCSSDLWMQIESHGQGDEQRQHIGRHSRPSQQTFNQTDHRQNWAPYCRYCQTEFPSLRDDGFSSRLTQASLSCNCLSCRDNLAYIWLRGGERQDLLGQFFL